MADYNNKGSVWKRQSRESDDPSKKYPQYTGNFTDANGVVKNVAMWINTNKEKDTHQAKDDSKKEIRLTRLKRLEKKLKSNILKRKQAISKNG